MGIPKLLYESVRQRAQFRCEYCHYPELLSSAPLSIDHMILIDAATSANDLRVPPGNRLEKLVGDRQGQYSIRINDQWRICFVWTNENNANQVEIVDYH